MEKNLATLMSLVDMSVNHSVSESRRISALNCAYNYKQWLEYSIFTQGYKPDLERAETYKQKALKEADVCGITLQF